MFHVFKKNALVLEGTHSFLETLNSFQEVVSKLVPWIKPIPIYPGRLRLRMSARGVHSIAKSRPQGGKKNLRAIGDRSRMGLLEMWVST